jgi:hypothetical protein
VRRLGCGEVGVPSSLIDGGFPASTVDDCTRLVNKTAFFPTGGVDGGVKLLVLLLLSVGLVLGTIVDSSLSSFTESGVLRFVLLLSWERVGDLVIPDVGLLFRSPAFGPVAAELLSPSFPAVLTVDVRSALSIRLGEWPGDGLCGISNVLVSLCKREGGTCLASPTSGSKVDSEHPLE